MKAEKVLCTLLVSGALLVGIVTIIFCNIELSSSTPETIQIESVYWTSPNYRGCDGGSVEVTNGSFFNNIMVALTSSSEVIHSEEILSQVFLQDDGSVKIIVTKPYQQEIILHNGEIWTADVSFGDYGVFNLMILKYLAVRDGIIIFEVLH